MKMYKKSKVIDEAFYDTECPRCHKITTYKSSELHFLGPDSLGCGFICENCLHIYEDFEVELKEDFENHEECIDNGKIKCAVLKVLKEIKTEISNTTLSLTDDEGYFNLRQIESIIDNKIVEANNGTSLTDLTNGEVFLTTVPQYKAENLHNGMIKVEFDGYYEFFWKSWWDANYGQEKTKGDCND